MAATVSRRWDDGTLLRAYAIGSQCPRLETPLRGPRRSEINDDLAAVREWIATLQQGSRDGGRYDLEWTQIGGRAVGRNQWPTRAVVSTYDQAWALLGKTATVRRFDEVLRRAAVDPLVAEWVRAQPLAALDHADVLPQIVAAVGWLTQHRGSHRYLREISAPGVDTKFAEKHRKTLADILGVSAAATGFLEDLGLRGKPTLLRMRPGARLGLPAALTELAVRADEAVALDIAPRTAVIVENEISYLSLPVADDGVIVWGKGFSVDHVGRLPWLADAEVRYWGDIDTHGFAILDRLRAALPTATSVLMDRATLLAHRDRWGQEPRPTNAYLTRLTPPEQDLYADLVADRLGPRVRLEQERVQWDRVLGEISGRSGARQPE